MAKRQREPETPVADYAAFNEALGELEKEVRGPCRLCRLPSLVAQPPSRASHSLKDGWPRDDQRADQRIPSHRLRRPRCPRCRPID